MDPFCSIGKQQHLDELKEVKKKVLVGASKSDHIFVPTEKKVR